MAERRYILSYHGKIFEDLEKKPAKKVYVVSTKKSQFCLLSCLQDICEIEPKFIR